MVGLINGRSKSRDSEDPKFQRDHSGRGFVNCDFMIFERETANPNPDGRED